MVGFEVMLNNVKLDGRNFTQKSESNLAWITSFSLFKNQKIQESLSRVKAKKVHKYYSLQVLKFRF
jgi:hypothetical protein